MSARVAVDHDALLCALVLAPTTFARNRFFALYTQPSARRTRSRAAQLRSIVRHFAAHSPKSELYQMAQRDDGDTVIRYGMPDLHFHRTATLSPLELAVVRYALSRRSRAPFHGEALLSTDADRRMVEDALLKLGRKLGQSLVAEQARGNQHTTPTGES